MQRMLLRSIDALAFLLDCGVPDSEVAKALEVPSGGGYAVSELMRGKRHIVADMDGQLPMINLATAAARNRVRAVQTFLLGIRRPRPWSKHLSANGAHDRCESMKSA